MQDVKNLFREMVDWYYGHENLFYCSPEYEISFPGFSKMVNILGVIRDRKAVLSFLRGMRNYLKRLSWI